MAFSELSDQELIAEEKKLKSSSIINAGLCGLLIGIAFYSTVKNGLGFFTFFPLYFVFVVFNNRKKTKELDEELKSRNLR